MPEISELRREAIINERTNLARRFRALSAPPPGTAIIQALKKEYEDNGGKFSAPLLPLDHFTKQG